MLDIQRYDHIGIRIRIRISDREIAVAFYESLGFEFIAGAAFDQGHPILTWRS